MQSLPDEMSPALTRVCRLYEKLDKTSTELLKSVYSDDIVFRDPLHEDDIVTVDISSSATPCMKSAA